MLNKSVMLEFLCVRESAVLCDRLIQSLLKWEDITGERLSEDTRLALDHLLKTLRRGEVEFIDMLELENDEIYEDIDRLEANSVGRNGNE